MIENQQFKLGVKTIDFSIQEGSSENSPKKVSTQTASLFKKKELLHSDTQLFENQPISPLDRYIAMENKLAQNHKAKQRSSLKIIVDGRDLLTNLKNQSESTKSIEFHKLKQTLHRFKNSQTSVKADNVPSQFKISSIPRIKEQEFQSQSSSQHEDNGNRLSNGLAADQDVIGVGIIYKTNGWNKNTRMAINSMPSDDDNSENLSSSSSSSEAPKQNPHYLEAFKSNQSSRLLSGQQSKLQIPVTSFQTI